MIIADFTKGYDEIITNKLVQWDYGQKLRIYGLNNLSEVIEVHFCDNTCEKAIVRTASKFDGGYYEVGIPDSLIENKYDINAFVYITGYEVSPEVNSKAIGTYYIVSNDIFTPVILPDNYVEDETYYTICGQTIKKIKIPVDQRKQPEDYVDLPDPTNEAKLSILLAHIEALNSKFARVFGMNDERLDIEVCEEEPEEQESNKLYLFPDNDFEDLTDKIENIINGTQQVGNAALADNITNFTVTQDENGILKINDIIIPQEKVLWSGNTTCGASAGYIDISLNEAVNDGDRIQLIVDVGLGKKEFTFVTELNKNVTINDTNTYSPDGTTALVYSYGTIINISSKSIKVYSTNCAIVAVNITKTEMVASGNNLNSQMSYNQPTTLFEVRRIIK